jgi:AcrR family transcriptional regulator
VGGHRARVRASALRTEQQVVDTAHRLLLERGYAGLAMADLATEAGVSVPLLYKVFGPKPRLVKRVYDVLLAGATALAGHLAETGALAPGLPVERARDLIWLHTAPDTYRLLVLERGWTLDEWERWFTASLAAVLLPGGAGPAGGSRAQA